MRIAIDGNEANATKRVGIGKYAFNLLCGLSKYQDKHSFSILFKDPPKEDLPEQTNKWKYFQIGPSFLWSQIAFPYYLITHRKYDAVFSPTHYGPRLTPIPSIISIMDLSYIYYPELFKKQDLYKLTNWTSYSVKQASFILTISEFTKKDIIKNYQVNEDKIIVTYPGYNSKIYNINYANSEVEAIKNKYSLNKYLIFVGTIQPRKNITKLVEAYKILISKHENLKLVIVGKKGWLFELVFNILAPYIKDKKVFYLDYLPDKEIVLLYQGALAFVLPSLYEGFGLTVIEAMASGCPIAVSNVSSLPEIAGENAFYFDPNQVLDIVQKIDSILSLTTSQRADVIRKGIIKASQYSWDKCARKTIEVIEKVNSNK